MKAVSLHSYGDPEQLRYEEIPVPKYGDNGVLVKMLSTSVNPIDVKIRSEAAKSRFSLEFLAILGRDHAGEVAEMGRNVQGFPKGIRVMALAGGTCAEYTVAKADVLAAIPEVLSFEQAGALPLIGATGAQLIERAVKPNAGQTLLVTGALGGVARTAVHVARKHGARVSAGARAT
jgi:NADPH:quinone reductase-like Zn-dependent oxidoreductase